MANMSYCRFRNTLQDLRDCAENIEKPLTDRDENEARKKLVQVCRDIVEAADNEEGHECEDCGEYISDAQYRNGGVCSDCGHQRVEDSETEQSQDGR